jgi:hypothetical protein
MTHARRYNQRPSPLLIAHKASDPDAGLKWIAEDGSGSRRNCLGYFYNAEGRPVSAGRFDDRKQKTGIWLTFHPNLSALQQPGSIHERLPYIQGKLDGIYKSYFPAKTPDGIGNLEVEGLYKNNKKEDIWRRFYNNIDQNNNPLPFASTTYKKGIRQGDFELLQRTGEIINKGPYDNDVKHGIWQERKGIHFYYHGARVADQAAFDAKAANFAETKTAITHPASRKPAAKKNISGAQKRRNLQDRLIP